MMRSIDSNRVNKARLMRVLLAGTAISAAATLQAAAQLATWSLTPGSSDYNLSTNWNPNTVPGPTGTAVFDVTGRNSVTFSAASTVVSLWNFNSTAPAYNFGIAGGKSLKFSTVGVNRGAIITTGNPPIDIANFGPLTFSGNSGVGPATITTKSGGSTVFDIGGQTDGI